MDSFLNIVLLPRPLFYPPNHTESICIQHKSRGCISATPASLFLINDFPNGVYGQEVFFRQFLHRDSVPKILYNLAVSLLQFLPVARRFSPSLFLRLVGGDVKIAPLNIVLLFLDQRIGKKISCIDVFHAGFLLEVIVKQQSQHIDDATIFTPCKRRNLPALHGAVLHCVLPFGIPSFCVPASFSSCRVGFVMGNKSVNKSKGKSL